MTAAFVPEVTATSLRREMAAMVAGASVAELSTDVNSTVEHLRELGETYFSVQD